MGTFWRESELISILGSHALILLQGKIRAHIPNPESNTIQFIPVCGRYLQKDL